jgi:hypothetical protein
LGKPSSRERCLSQITNEAEVDDDRLAAGAPTRGRKSGSPALRVIFCADAAATPCLTRLSIRDQSGSCCARTSFETEKRGSMRNSAPCPGALFLVVTACSTTADRVAIEAHPPKAAASGAVASCLNVHTGTVDTTSFRSGEFDATVTLAVDGSGGTTNELVLRRNGTTRASAVATHRPDGSVQVSWFEDGEFGESKIEGFISTADGKMFTGVINGRALAPFDIASAKIGGWTPRFADGTLVASLTPTTNSALERALRDRAGLGAECESGIPVQSSPSDPTPSLEGKSYVSHRTNIPADKDSACDNCKVKCDASASGFMAAGVVACFAFLSIPGAGVALALACQAANVGIWAGVDELCKSNCASPGNSCCPVACGQYCCGDGETCADHWGGLCCGKGYKVCVGLDSRDSPTCASLGPTADLPYLPPAEDCLPSGACQKDKVCGQKCCTGAEICEGKHTPNARCVNELDCDVCGAGATSCCPHGLNGLSGCVADQCCPPGQVTTIGTCCPDGKLADSNGGCTVEDCGSLAAPFLDNKGQIVCCDASLTLTACNGSCCDPGYTDCSADGACTTSNGGIK